MRGVWGNAVGNDAGEAGGLSIATRGVIRLHDLQRFLHQARRALRGTLARGPHASLKARGRANRNRRAPPCPIPRSLDEGGLIAILGPGGNPRLVLVAEALIKPALPCRFKHRQSLPIRLPLGKARSRRQGGRANQYNQQTCDTRESSAFHRITFWLLRLLPPKPVTESKRVPEPAGVTINIQIYPTLSIYYNN